MLESSSPSASHNTGWRASPPQLARRVAAACMAWGLVVSCTVREPQPTTYFQQKIAATLTNGCVRSPTGSGCHVSDERGDAFGNLDVTLYSNVDKRRDLLVAYGPYPQPGLLLKNLPPMQIQVRAYDGTTTTVTTDIKHTGGPILDPTASAYQTLRRWIDNGATENNTGKKPLANASLACTPHTAYSTHDLTADPPNADWATFRDVIGPMLIARCGAGNCHGSASNDLSFSCGGKPEDARANYWSAGDYVDPQPEQSELVRRPLTAALGGAFHEGGAIFTSVNDDDYTQLVAWAKAHGAPAVDSTPGFSFFAHRVQPVLVRKGCMQLQCHSASIFHDYRLRGGSGGSFSLTATRKNYELSIAQLAFESDDPGVSRLVRKNLFRPDLGGTGILHRGGGLLEDFPSGPATPALCDGKGYDYDSGDLDKIPGYCVIREWLGRERAARPVAPLSAIVYVRRDLTSAKDTILDFDSYAPGSDLRIADAKPGVNGTILIANDRSLMSGCALARPPPTSSVLQ